MPLPGLCSAPTPPPAPGPGGDGGAEGLKAAAAAAAARGETRVPPPSLSGRASPLLPSLPGRASAPPLPPYLSRERGAPSPRPPATPGRGTSAAAAQGVKVARAGASGRRRQLVGPPEKGARRTWDPSGETAPAAHRGRAGERGAGPQSAASTQRPARRPGLRLDPRGHVVQRALHPGEYGPGAAPGHRCGATRSGHLPHGSRTPLPESLWPRSPTPPTWVAEKVWAPHRLAASQSPPDSGAVPSHAGGCRHLPLRPSLFVLSGSWSPADSLEPQSRLSPLGAGVGHQLPPRHLACGPVSSFKDPVPGSLQ